MTGWLVAWLWQGMVLALAISAAFRLSPRVNASTRYLIWWCAFAVLVWLGWSTSPHTATLSIDPAATAAGHGSVPPALFEVAPFPEWLLTSIVVLWVSVAVFRLLRILPGLHALYRLKDSCEPVRQTIEAQLPLWLEVKNSGRAIQLMICDNLPNASVLGLQQPYIAFPSRLLEIVSAAELDQIVLHEYGHVQRRDDWTRLAQALLEAALWMHPAARWIGSELNLEREVACDDWVVSKTCAARAYAGCLSRVAENHQAAAAASLAPALFGRTPDVLRRIDRLLNPKRNATRKLSFATAGLAMCIIATSAAHLRAFSLVGEMRAVLVMPQVPALIRLAVFTARGPEVPAAAQTTSAAAAPARTRPRAGADATIPDVTSTALVVDDTATIVESRSFPAVYAQETHPAGQSAQKSPDGWQFGVRIGKATRKAGVAVAGSVAKTGASIAKSF